MGILLNQEMLTLSDSWEVWLFIFIIVGYNHAISGSRDVMLGNDTAYN